jgi:hypothetical protein
MSVELIEGDCREVLREFADASIDAVVTDPPYGLNFMGKAWDYDVPGVDIWREVLRVLKPGGHLLSFFGTRTYHRGVIPIEDAGFEIRDQIGWVYGSGFPKSSNQHDEWEGWGTALKPAWEPIVMARRPLIGTVGQNLAVHGVGALNIDGCRIETAEIRPLNSVQKAHDEFGTFIENGGRLRSTGSGANHELGRWPANLIHDGSDEVLAVFPSTPAASGGTYTRQPSDSIGTFKTRTRVTTSPKDNGGSAARFFYCAKASKADRDEGLDSSAIISILGAWENADQKVTLQVGMGTSHLRVIGVSGASTNSASEWSTLLFGNSLTAQYQTALKSITETKIRSTIASKIFASFLTFGISESIPAAISTLTGLNGNHAESAEHIGLSLTTTSEKMASVLGANRAALPMQLKISISVDAVNSTHPTVKPTDLMRYLCRLVTPPGGTVLDPFMGSGSTGRGAVLEGFNFIGIEMDGAYLDIADARIAAAEAQAMPQAAE